MREPLLFRKLLRLFEGPHSKSEKFPSYIHLAFCCFMAFDYQGSVEYFADKLRTECADLDTFCELMDLIYLKNEDGHRPSPGQSAPNGQ